MVIIFNEYLLIHAWSVTAGDNWEPRFEGLPFEFWVGGDAEIGTSVGQVRVSDMDPKMSFFDMFHHYQEGGKKLLIIMVQLLFLQRYCKKMLKSL